MAEKQTYQFKTEIEQLLDLLANALYTNKEIFLRELISNAADALNKIRFLSLTDSKILGDDAEFKIRIRFHEKEKTLEIEDNGVGMSEKELQENIGTIAKSGTLQFLKNIKKDQSLEQIGKFGVGFYSVFMVTDKVVVESKHYKSKSACRWISEGKSNYTIEQIEKKTRGTKITFTLKKEEEEFANDLRLTHIIQKYSNFVPLKKEDEKKLDSFEKVPMVYKKIIIHIDGYPKNSIFTYIKSLKYNLAPSLNYLTRIAQGYRDFGLNFCHLKEALCRSGYVGNAIFLEKNFSTLSKSLQKPNFRLPSSYNRVNGEIFFYDNQKNSLLNVLNELDKYNPREIVKKIALFPIQKTVIPAWYYEKI